MAALGLSSVNILTNGGSVTVKAETDIEFEFVFDRDLIITDEVTFRCHVFEPVYFLDYYLDDIVFKGFPQILDTSLAKANAEVAKKRQAAADKMKEVADKAKEVADKAKEVADKAKEEADKIAATTAEEAKKAQKAAAKAAALAVKANALAAKVGTNKARQAATIAQAVADRARETAETAQAAADTAKEAADRAKEVADEAQKAADRAKEAADTAKEVADKAKDDAEKAQNAADQKHLNKKTLKLKFPEELAGADNLELTFYRKNDSTAIISMNDSIEESTVFGATRTDPIFKVLAIESNQAGAPLIEAVHWGDNEEIQFGTHSPTRTGTIHRNETGYLHIHTRGLYGKEIDIGAYLWDSATGAHTPASFANFGKHKIRDNASVRVFQFWYLHTWITTYRPGSNTIKATVSYGTGATAITQDANDIAFDLNNDATIIPVTATVIASPGRDINPPLGSDAQCRVEFRPKEHDYDGRFGFSWFRKGDLSEYVPTTTRHTGTDSNRSNINVTVNLPCNDQRFESLVVGGVISLGGRGAMGRHFSTTDAQQANSSQFPPPVRTTGIVVQNGNDASHFFDIDPIMVENHKLDYRKLVLHNMPDEYLVPVMTLKKGIKANLRLFIEAKKKVNKLVFEFDNPQALKDGYLEITPREIPDIKKTKYKKSNYEIEVECKKEFSKELLLRVKAYPEKTLWGKIKSIFGAGEDVIPDICGAVKLLPNDISHQRKIKVVFFNMITNTNATSTDEEGSPAPPLPAGAAIGTPPPLNSHQNDVIKYLNQAYLDVEFEPIVNINLTPPSVPPAAGTVTDYTTYFGFTRMNSSGLRVIDYANSSSLREFLLNHSQTAGYEDHFKIYFTQDECHNFTENYSLEGFSSGEKFTICFSASSIADSTPTHELLHSLGLPHTFDGSTSRAKYVYQECMTDNIMDYSNLIGVDAHSLFHWQWKSINNQLP